MNIAAFILGFAGSFHCLGMCSPLVMAVSILRGHAVASRFFYNAGRIFTYTLLGLGVSSIGEILPLHKFQNLISIALGIAILLVGLLGVTTIRIPLITNGLQKMTTGIKSLFGKFIHQKSSASLIILGMINGILPCGLTVLALTFCVALKPFEGFAYMLWFGLGTLPVMLGITSILHALLKAFSSSLPNLKYISTGMLVFSGCLLIARVLFFHHHHLVTETQNAIDITMCR